MAEQRFSNGYFDGWKWKAKLIQEPQALENYFDELQLIGRTIVSAKFVGFDFEAFKYYKTHRVLHPAKSYASNFVELDEPFILILDDGRRLEMTYDDGSTFRISINKLSLNIKSNYEEAPVNGEIFFRNIFGATITRIIVNRTDEEPDFTSAYGFHLNDDETQKEFIESVIFEMSNGYQIYLTSFFDYGHVFIEKIGKEKQEWKREESWTSLDSKEKKNLSTPIISMGNCKVMYDNWEMQCCGKPFHTGSHVTWLAAKIGDDYLPNYKGEVDFHYQGHYSEEYIAIVKGVVKSIIVRYHTYKEGKNCFVPDKEKSMLVKSVDGWEEYTDGEWKAYDYIVELKNVTVQETGYKLNKPW